jgi:hypothetical protein
MNRLMRTISRQEYARHLAHVATLRTVYVIPIKDDPGLRAHNRLAMRQALAWARYWRITSMLP